MDFGLAVAFESTYCRPLFRRCNRTQESFFLRFRCILLRRLDRVVDRTYPLTRTVYIYLRHDQDLIAPVNVLEFIRYILSGQGQR